MDLINAFEQAVQENLKLAKNLNPIYKIGDKVRVLKSLEINVSAVQDFLGSVCTVEEVNIHSGAFSRPKIEYLLSLGNKIEPF